MTCTENKLLARNLSYFGAKKCLNKHHDDPICEGTSESGLRNIL